MTKEIIKHLVKCRCILPQFKSSSAPIFHKFVVASIVENDVVLEKIVQCNNCGVLHRVNDLCVSEIVEMSDLSNVCASIDDARMLLPTQVCSVLESVSAPLFVWEGAKFVVDEKKFDHEIEISSETIGSRKSRKLMKIHPDMHVELLTKVHTRVLGQ